MINDFSFKDIAELGGQQSKKSFANCYKTKKEVDNLLSGLKAELSKAIDKFDKELKTAAQNHTVLRQLSPMNEKSEHRRAELLSNPGKVSTRRRKDEG